MATTVRITETYDMKTTINRMGLVGIHTPSVSLLQKMYPGLMKNHKFVRFVKCDVVGACASVLPADPLQVGVESGDVAPEDMFNPILYSAMTNESFDTLASRIYGISDVNPLLSVAKGNVSTYENTDTHFAIYYALLAENGKYRKAMPQSGFAIKGLVPLCHTLISTFGNVGPQGNNVVPDEEDSPVYVPSVDVPELDGLWSTEQTTATYFKGKSVKMPKFPLHVGVEAVSDIPNPNIPKTYVAMLCIPPARLHEFYYRMRVTWTIRFENVCSALESGNTLAYAGVMGSSYAKSFNYTSSKSELDNDTDMVSTSNVDLNKIMES